jgi:hypothetical protein
VHDTVLVYVGSDPEQRALSGTLTMRRDESVAFWRWLGGAAVVGGDPEPIEVEVPRG